MTQSEVIEHLAQMNRAQVARDTGLDYMWLYSVQKGRIKSPGTQKFDVLRAYVATKTGATQ